MHPFSRILVLAAISILSAQTVSEQPPETWARRYIKARLNDVAHPYENGFTWDRDNSLGVVFQGHLGTYTALNDVWPAFGNVYNTNQTWYYTHENAAFTVTHPYDRPQKTCGAKTYYDESMKRFVIYGGSFHASDNGHYEVGPRGDTLVEEVLQSGGINHPRLPWVMDGASKQWYEMRSLLEGPPISNNWWGYNTNFVYVREYGLGVLMPANGPRVYMYSAHANSWFNIVTANPAAAITRSTPPAAYDLRNRVIVAPDSGSTHLLESGTWAWRNLTPSPAPAITSTQSGWYDGFSCMYYDRNSGKSIFVRDDGAQTWAFDAAAETWTQTATADHPGSGGSMAEGFTYDPAEKVGVLFSNQADEIWTYRHALPDTAQLEEPEGFVSTTTEDSVILTWSPASSGSTADKYYVFRATWSDHASSLASLVPGPYALVDSVAGTRFADAPPKAAQTFYSYSLRPAAGARTGDMSNPVFSRRPAPLCLTATVFSRNKVGLKWLADTAPDVAGYNVYRKKGAIPRYADLEKLNTAPVGPKPVFLDTTVAITGDTLFNYVVTTVNRFGQESGLSPRADTRISRVMGLWFDTTANTLNWSPTAADTFREYQVWVQPVGTFDGGVANFQRAFANIRDTFKVVSRTWHYKVRVVNAIGQSGHFSDLVPVASIWDENSGMLMGDGMLVRPESDPVWARVGLAPDEIAVERRPGRDYAQSDAPLLTVSPNPFNPSTTIRAARVPARASFGIFDARGRLIRDLTGLLKARPDGLVQVQWKADGIPAGVYFAVIRYGKMTKTAGMALIR